MYPRWRTIRGCSSISRRFGAEDGPGEVVVLISHPLVDVGRELPQVPKVAVELVGDDEALFAVEVADREAIGTLGRVGVDGADVIVVDPHHLQQLIQIVPLPPNGQLGQALPNLPESLFHAFPIRPWIMQSSSLSLGARRAPRGSPKAVFNP